MTRAASGSRGREGGLREALRDLKQRGPQILVTGDVPEPVSRRATRRLLGHPDEHRYRVLALADTDEASDRWLPAGVSTADDDVAVIGRNDLRASVASRGAEDGPAGPDAIAGAVGAEIEGWVDPRETPAPSVLRVGLYSLETLLEERGIDAVRSLAYRLTGTVRRARGMGHYHLPRSVDSGAVDDLRYVFDARLELRGAEGAVQQRWHLPGTGTTGWVELTDDS